MQINNSLATLSRATTINARNQRLAQESESRDVVRSSTASDRNQDPSRNRLVEQTLQGEVLDREQSLRSGFNPLTDVTPRTFNVSSRRDQTQSAVAAYEQVAQQADRENLISTLGIDVFA